MKVAGIISGLFVVVALGVSSCSKCYDCSHVVEIQTPTGTELDTVNEDFCTASQDELASKEADGYTCSPS